MKIYIARHGQPAVGDLPPGSNHELPPGDNTLTTLGQQQAKLLGQYLRQAGFAGKVITSPYARTVETADIVCSECDTYFYPEAAIQEIRMHPEMSCQGMTLPEIRERFSRLADDAWLFFPWKIVPVETGVEVWARVQPYLQQLELTEDVLFVGHGATVSCLKRYFADLAGETLPPSQNWNCAYSAFERDDDGNWRVLANSSYDFLPLEMVTSNRKRFGELE